MFYWQNLNLKNYPGERWKDIPICKGRYQASNFGRIKRLERTLIRYNNRPQFFREMIMSQLVEHHGYLRVGIIDDKGKQKFRKVHVLVAMAWIPNPEQKPFVNHKKGIKTDNRPHQIEWAIHAENINHAIRHKLQAKRRIGESNNFSKITNKMAIAIYQDDRQRKLVARDFGVNKQLISTIKIGRAWSGITGQPRIKRKQMSHTKIMKIFNSTMLQRQTAKKFNVPEATVRDIQSGRRYSYITANN